MPIPLPQNLTSIQSNTAIDSYSKFRLRVKLIQAISTTSLTLIPFACLKHGKRSMTISLQEMPTRFGGHAIRLLAENINAHGKIGVANAVMRIVQKKFLEQWKLTILSHQIMQLLTFEAQVGIEIHKQNFQWIDPFSNETVDKSCLLLNEVLKMMCPDVQTNVYAELAKIKSIKLVNHAFNIVKLHSAMESKQISIKQKVPGIYHKSQYIIDYLNGLLTIEV
jgi:hypothetical protein